ncbi:MAG: putative molybdenum carrier protein [candidate division WOR-3 bacterium]
MHTNRRSASSQKGSDSGATLQASLRIISGGQTGVDRAALDAALEMGIPCGGWCPKGRLAEDGCISQRYPLKETRTSQYQERTRLNVRDSEGTLILKAGELKGGTALTVKLARGMKKPLLLIDLELNPDPARVRRWIHANNICVLNVAGPRESGSPGIHDLALGFLRKVFQNDKTGKNS